MISAEEVLIKHLPVVFALAILAALVSYFSLFGRLHFSEDSTDKLSAVEVSFLANPCGFAIHVAVLVSCYSLEAEGSPQLPVVRIALKSDASDKPNEQHDPNMEAILIIPGGPGQGMMTAQDSVDYYAQWMIEQQVPFDLVLMESRGNRLSSIDWTCMNYENENRKLVAQNISLLDEYTHLVDISQQCLSQYDAFLREAGMQGGIQDISTAGNSADIDNLISVLEYEAWHFLGTSYGTRLALYAAENPKVKTLTLDSPYPFDKGTLLDWPKIIENTFLVHEEKFQAFLQNGETYLSYYKALEKRLENNAMSFNLKLWDDSGYITFVLNPQRLQALHFFVLYDESLLDFYYSGLIHLALGETDDEDMQWVLESFVSNNFDTDFNSMVFFATECNDNSLVDLDLYKKQVGAMRSELRSAVGEEGLIFEWEFDVCHHELFKNSKRIHGRSYSEKPALIFSGEIDPVTPPDWAYSLAEDLANPRVVEVPGVGHAVLSSEVCELEGLFEFWKSGDPNTPVQCALDRSGSDEAEDSLN